MPVSAQTSIFPPPTLIHCDLQCKCNKTQSNIPSKNRLWQHNYRFPTWTVLKCDSGGHIELEKTRSPLQEISLTTDVTSRSVKSRIKDKQGKKLTSLTGNFTSRSRIKDAHYVPVWAIASQFGETFKPIWDHKLSAMGVFFPKDNQEFYFLKIR